VELIQAPFGVVALGAAGVALGRRAPTPLLAPLLLAVLFTLETVLVSWQSPSAAQWLLPFASDIVVVPDTWVPCTPADAARGCSAIAGFDVAGMGRHIPYLLAVTAACSLAALARTAWALALAAGAVALMLVVG
jgi:hypothetical protein